MKRVNPLSFRLRTGTVYNSYWFTNSSYSINLHLDKEIRGLIKKRIKDDIICIKIFRKIDLIKIIIYIASFSMIKKSKDVEELPNDLRRRRLLINQSFFTSIKRVKNPYKSSNILTKYIALHLKRRIPTYKIIKKAIELSKKSRIKGIKLRISGCIDGKISKVLWIREGVYPIQTIQAKFDYYSYAIKTIYGILGIKIWIFLKC
uniref:Small ribosomal subunit protein uS3c n=1 Tax=Sciaphila thaidanica TaxID=2161793 RepID=A0A2R4PAL9_9LILI|nr:ribosomal protein S3 [Sciaphila thaidanica]